MKEEEIRPQLIFDEYLRLTKLDTETYFRNVKKEACNCPACDEVGEFAFNKNGFEYQVCSCCETLYVSPRPIASAFDTYYTESPSSKYWATTFYKLTEESRREKLWKPKASMIIDIMKFHNCSNYSVIDIGGGYGLFAEEIRKLSNQNVVVIEPAPHLADVCRKKGLDVVEKFLEKINEEDLPIGHKVFVSFELFEHLHNPLLFLRHLWKLMRSGDIFIFTTLSGIGLDIQVLWENSKSVSPPHHLNFFNPKSTEKILEKIGFQDIQITTPGKLDLDILFNNQHFIKDRFWKAFLKFSDANALSEWQEFISNNGSSSHMMAVCKKP